MRDAVTTINIENPVARESFIRWWRTMEAQGYQYGFEALCNVWVGFDDGRVDLARKVLDAVSGERLTENLDNEGDRGYSQALDDVVRALQNLFAREGVNSTAPIATTPAAPSPGEPPEICVWTLDDSNDGAIWETSCGQAFSFTDGGVEDNGFVFCYKCGKRIDPGKYSDSSSVEGETE